MGVKTIGDNVVRACDMGVLARDGFSILIRILSLVHNPQDFFARSV